MNNREFLFHGFSGCTDGNCLITGKANGMHTNGGCKCLTNMSRSQLTLLQSRLFAIAENDSGYKLEQCE